MLLTLTSAKSMQQTETPAIWYNIHMNNNNNKEVLMDVEQVFSTSNTLYFIGILVTAIGGLGIRWLGKLQEDVEALNKARTADLQAVFDFKLYVEQDFAKRAELTERFSEIRSYLVRIEDKLYNTKN